MPSQFHPNDLYARLGTAKAPLLLDVRRAQAFETDDQLIVGSARRLPEDVVGWRNALPAGRAVVAYCVHGHEVSQGVASALQKSGVQAAYLEGGIAAWKERKLPTRRKRGAVENKWVTREHPKIDRIACPVADQPLRQSRCGIHLRPAQRCGEGRSRRGRHAL